LIVPILVCSGSCVIPFLAKNPQIASPHTVLPSAASTSETVHTAAGFAILVGKLLGKFLVIDF